MKKKHDCLLCGLFLRIHLFESCPYSETEKNECLKEAQELRTAVGGQYTELVLPSFPLSKKIECLSWVAVGESLLTTYRCMMEDASSLVMFAYSTKFHAETLMSVLCFSFKENELSSRTGIFAGKSRNCVACSSFTKRYRSNGMH